VPGAAFGVLLFFAMDAFSLGLISGFPLVYSIRGTGYGPYPPSEPAYAIDLVFWVAVGIILIEIWERKGLHLLHPEDNQ